MILFLIQHGYEKDQEVSTRCSDSMLLPPVLRAMLHLSLLLGKEERLKVNKRLGTGYGLATLSLISHKIQILFMHLD